MSGRNNKSRSKQLNADQISSSDEADVQPKLKKLIDDSEMAIDGMGRRKRSGGRKRSRTQSRRRRSRSSRSSRR